MKTIRAASVVFAIMVGVGFQYSACGGQSGGFHFPVGLTYSKGAQDTMNKLLDYYEDEWGATDSTRLVIPVGLAFNPYYEWNLAHDIGVGAGLSLGPAVFVIGSLDSGGGSDETKVSGIIPLGMDARCTFFNTKNASPFVRLGFRHPVVFGDNIDSSSPGLFVGAGVEFWRTKAVGLSIEVGYDNSTVTLEKFNGAVKKDMTFAGFTVGVAAVF